jgi:hypothetical protein
MILNAEFKQRNYYLKAAVTPGPFPKNVEQPPRFLLVKKVFKRCGGSDFDSGTVFKYTVMC